MRHAWLKIIWFLAVLFPGQTDAAGSGAERQGCYGQIAGKEAGQSSRACQEIAQEGEATPDQENRKQYIRDVLSKSKLQNRRLARAGTGFFIDLDGNLITNFRLVDGCAAVSVSPVVGDMLVAQIVAYDTTLDLALVRADLRPPAIASLIGSEGALTREPTYIIGYPRSGPLMSSPVLTRVEVLGAQKTALGRPTVLVKGDVRSGNNGGPLLDSGGGVIGALIAGKIQNDSASSADKSLVGQALPTEAIREFLDARDVDYQIGLELPPKPPDRLITDARRFMAQIGCWQ